MSAEHSSQAAVLWDVDEPTDLQSSLFAIRKC